VGCGISRTRGNEWTTAAEDADEGFVGSAHHIPSDRQTGDVMGARTCNLLTSRLSHWFINILSWPF
jgi:hypothetical protein